MGVNTNHRSLILNESSEGVVRLRAIQRMLVELNLELREVMKANPRYGYQQTRTREIGIISAYLRLQESDAFDHIEGIEGAWIE
jgi:hypothetical protein